MKYFLNRQDPSYIEHLIEALDTASLIKSAVNATTPKNGLNRCIHIDFCGISGSTLLIEKKSALVVPAFEQIFNNIETLNKNGVYLKVRFIFPYLYSDFSFSLIAAELTPNRATIKDPKYIPRFNDGIQITTSEYHASSAYINQYAALCHIESLINKNSLKDRDNVNSLQVRFATIPLNLCTLIINEECFSDPYLYSRKSRDITGLANKYPILHLEKGRNEFEFNCVVDDFRYLWNHPQTLYYNDVIDYGQDGRPKIKEPEKIEFTNKSNRIEDLEKMSGGTLTAKEDIIKFKSLLEQNLRRYTRSFYKEKTQDSIFIACSWEHDEITNRNEPNKHAKSLQKQLLSDFGNIIKPIVVITELGADVFETIESELENSTLGIIIITKDIESNNKFYTKPNVYYEFGFLRNLLKSKVVALVQDGAIAPSNASNKGYNNFNNNILLEYLKIIIWIAENYRAIPPEMIIRALHDHEKRIKIFCLDDAHKLRGKVLLSEAKEFYQRYSKTHNLQLNK